MEKKNSCKHQPNEKKKVENSKKPEKTFVKLYSLHRAHFHQIEKCAGILTMTARYLSALLSVALKKLQIDIRSKSVSKKCITLASKITSVSQRVKVNQLNLERVLGSLLFL